jgi:hypothetical protein
MLGTRCVIVADTVQLAYENRTKECRGGSPHSNSPSSHPSNLLPPSPHPSVPKKKARARRSTGKLASRLQPATDLDPPRRPRRTAEEEKGD